MYEKITEKFNGNSKPPESKGKKKSMKYDPSQRDPCFACICKVFCVASGAIML